MLQKLPQIFFIIWKKFHYYQTYKGIAFKHKIMKFGIRKTAIKTISNMTLFTRGSSPALRCSRSTDPVHRLAFKQQGKARTPARVSMKPHVCKTWVYFGYVWRSFNIEAIAGGDTSRIRIHNSAYCTLNFVRIHVPLHTSSDTDAVLKASGKLLKMNNEKWKKASCHLKNVRTQI